MPAKRTAESKSKTSTGKRAKVVKTHLEKNIEKVMGGLTNQDFVIPCREIFTDVMDKVLKTPKEERHENQDAVIGMMMEVFATEQVRFQARIAEAKVAVDAANAEREDKIVRKNAADADVHAQRAEVSGKEEARDDAIQVVNECAEELQQALDLWSEAESQESVLVKQQAEDSSMLHRSVTILKEGTCCDNTKELKQHLAAITSFFKKVDVEEALIKAIPRIYCRKPEERGSFDQIASAQLDLYVEKHLNDLEGKIQAARETANEHDVAVTAWRACLEVAQHKKRESEETLQQAQAKLENFDGSLKAARSVLKEHTALVKARNNDLIKEEIGSGEIEEIQKALEHIQVYTVPAPQEEEPAMEVEEPTVESIVPMQIETKTNKDSGHSTELPNIPSPQKQSSAVSVA